MSQEVGSFHPKHCGLVTACVWAQREHCKELHLRSCLLSCFLCAAQRRLSKQKISRVQHRQAISAHKHCMLVPACVWTQRARCKEPQLCSYLISCFLCAADNGDPSKNKLSRANHRDRLFCFSTQSEAKREWPIHGCAHLIAL